MAKPACMNITKEPQRINLKDAWGAWPVGFNGETKQSGEFWRSKEKHGKTWKIMKHHEQSPFLQVLLWQKGIKTSVKMVKIPHEPPVELTFWSNRQAAKCDPKHRWSFLRPQKYWHLATCWVFDVSCEWIHVFTIDSDQRPKDDLFIASIKQTYLVRW